MKKTSIICLITFLLISLPLYAQDQVTENLEETVSVIPSKISYQGVLTGNAGNPLNGTFSMTFGLYASASGGTSCWSENQSVEVIKGVFNVLLGNNNPISTCAFDVPYWLGITVEDTTLTPRIELSSTAYSMRTRSVEDGSITNSSIAPGQVVKGLNNLKDNVNIVGDSNVNITTSGSTITISASGGGGGTVTEVNTGSGLTGGPINTTGTIRIPNSGVTNSHLADNSVDDSKISFPFSKTKTSGGILFSIINNGSGVGISGLGNSKGVWGETPSTSGYGVYGLATSTSGSNYGVYGLSSSSTGTGVYGKGFFGLWGNSNNSNSSLGLIATTSGNKVAELHGNTDVYGNLSKYGGNFEIDHPLDPANKILRHSFVESPDMMNVYNGNVTTDASGFVNVQLPDYFEALNKDFRYQLTVVGQFAQAIISQEIQKNIFTIQTDKPNI